MASPAPSLPSYLAVPSAAVPIPDPSIPPIASSSSHSTHADHTSFLHRPHRKSTTAASSGNGPRFPPSAASLNAPPTRKIPLPSALSTNIPDLLLSSLLPPNLPKLASASTPNGTGKEGTPRSLTSQKDALSVQVIGNNFRRFVTKCGPCFWVQDRVEEVLFWRKPTWTWGWFMLWGFVSFQPRALLLLPSLGIILVILHNHERTSPLPSLLGVSLPPADATMRYNTSNPSTRETYSATTAPDGEGQPVAPPKDAESSVDVYMNLQAIQNLMGVVSDFFEFVNPRLAAFSSPSTAPTAFPLSSTHVLILLLLPTLLLPLAPDFLIPYLLLPVGWAPPLIFHPNLNPLLVSLPRNPQVLRARAWLENVVLTDQLTDELGRKEIGRVEVWENERLDPAIASKKDAPGKDGWGSKHLRAGERKPWIKVMGDESLWLPEDVGSSAMQRGTGGAGSSSTDGSVQKGAGKGSDKDKEKEKEKGQEMVLALREGWTWVPGEEWRVDVGGNWASGSHSANLGSINPASHTLPGNSGSTISAGTAGSDEDGWVYTDDSWQNPAPRANTDAASELGAGGSGTGLGIGLPGQGKDAMPQLALRRVTRRRMWWRRVYYESDPEGADKAGLGRSSAST